MSESPLKPLEKPEATERQRERSTIGFPYGDLRDAVQVAEAVHKLGGTCTNDQLAAELGHKSIDSGTFGIRLATARWFGLISSGRETITLLAMGQRIVDPVQTVQAKAEAFLTVPLYKALYDKCKGYTLPPTPQGLENVLVELGVSPKQKDKARQALIRSAEYAGFFYQGRERLVMPVIVNQPPPVADEPGEKGEGGNRGGSGAGGRGSGLPTLIQGLVEKLPPEGAVWSDPERQQWLDTAKMIFGLVYKAERLALPSGHHSDNGHSGGLAGQNETVGA